MSAEWITKIALFFGICALLIWWLIRLSSTLLNDANGGFLRHFSAALCVIAAVGVGWYGLTCACVLYVEQTSDKIHRGISHKDVHNVLHHFRETKVLVNDVPVSYRVEGLSSNQARLYRYDFCFQRRDCSVYVAYDKSWRVASWVCTAI